MRDFAAILADTSPSPKEVLIARVRALEAAQPMTPRVRRCAKPEKWESRSARLRRQMDAAEKERREKVLLQDQEAMIAQANRTPRTALGIVGGMAADAGRHSFWVVTIMLCFPPLALGAMIVLFFQGLIKDTEKLLNR